MVNITKVCSNEKCRRTIPMKNKKEEKTEELPKCPKCGKILMHCECEENELKK